MKTLKCSFTHCSCEETLTPENAVKVSNRYYHRECAHKREMLQQIRAFYISHIDSQVVQKVLNAVIKSVVIDKKVSPDYLLFALKYAYETDKKIKSPQYLHYLADDKRIQRLYKLAQTPPTGHQTVSIDTEFDFSGMEEENVCVKKPFGFSDILSR